MGYVKHDVVIVTLWEHCDDRIEDLKAKLRALEDMWPMESLLIGPIDAAVNETRTYFYAPDGSKEGWATSYLGDKARQAVIDHFRHVARYADIVELTYGADWASEHGPEAVDVSNGRDEVE